MVGDYGGCACVVCENVVRENVVRANGRLHMWFDPDAAGCRRRILQRNYRNSTHCSKCLRQSYRVRMDRRKSRWGCDNGGCACVVCECVEHGCVVCECVEHGCVKIEGHIDH
jgi:hypothetical protein